MSATSGRSVFRDGIYQSASDETVLPALLGITKEIWIALRTDGKAGAGTKTDPYDGSTKVKLDTLLRSFGTYITINLGPGTFETNGAQDYTANKGFIPKKGWRIIGSGIDITVLKLMSLNDRASGIPDSGVVIGDPGFGTDKSDSLVADLTIDCNGQNLSAGTVGGIGYKSEGIHLNGNNCTIRNVRAINGYGNLLHDKETFILAVTSYIDGGTWADVTNLLIENCIVDQPAAGNNYGVAINLFSAGVPWLASGALRNNIVRDWDATACYGFIGYDLELSGNQAIDCPCPFLRGDTGIVDGLLISNNRARNCDAFVQLYASLGTGAALRNITVDNNQFFCSGAKNFFGIQSDIGPGKVTGTIVRNNRVIQTGTVTTYIDKHVPLYLRDIDGAQIYGNDWDAPNAYQPADNIVTTRDVLFDPERTGVALSGAIKITATWAPNGYLFYEFDPSDYTIVAGDRLQYDVMIDADSLATTYPYGYLVITAGDGQVATDQNGVTAGKITGISVPDLNPFARGRWYSRDFDLTSYATKSATKFVMGDETSATGVKTFYFRNIRIVSNTGALRKTYFKEGDAAPILLLNSDVSGYSASISGAVATNIATTTAVLKGNNAGGAIAAVAKTDFWDTTDMVASGASHAKGLAPDPGASAGTTKYLREDATWAVPPASAGVTIDVTTEVLKGDGAGGGEAAVPGTDFQEPSTALTRLLAVATALSTTTPAINWNTTTTFSWTLSGNSTPTFSNATDGFDITVAVTNTASNYSLTWPAAVQWPDGGAQPTQTLGAFTDLWGFKQVGAVIYGAVLQNYS